MGAHTWMPGQCRRFGLFPLALVYAVVLAASLGVEAPAAWAEDQEDVVVLGPGEGHAVPVPGHTITFKLVGANTGGAYSFLEVEMDGDGPPQHIHKNEDEVYYVVEGEINVLLGERTFKARAGTLFLIPRGTVHTVSRATQEPAKMLAIFSPPGFEQFFEEAVDQDVTDTEAYVAKAEALSEKYNMEVVGPPLDLEGQPLKP